MTDTPRTCRRTRGQSRSLAARVLLGVLLAVTAMAAVACESAEESPEVVISVRTPTPSPTAAPVSIAPTPTAPAATPTEPPAAEATPEVTPETSSSILETATPTGTPDAAESATAAIPPDVSAEVAPTAPEVRADGIHVEVDPPAVGQGEAMLVRVPGAAGGTVIVRDLIYPLLPGVGEAWAVVGIPINARLGEAPIVVQPRDATGAALDEVTAAYTVIALERPVDYLTLTAEQGAVLTPEAGITEVQIRAQQFASFDSVPRWNTRFITPVRDPHFITTEFGQGRSINGGPVGGFHTGQDLAADEGTPIYASGPGRVSYADAMPIRGNSVLIDHGGGVITGYHHLHEIAVSLGQMVDTGAYLGTMGATGLATGPHLHWEISVYGVNVDPVTWTERSFRP